MDPSKILGSDDSVSEPPRTSNGNYIISGLPDTTSPRPVPIPAPPKRTLPRPEPPDFPSPAPELVDEAAASVKLQRARRTASSPSFTFVQSFRPLYLRFYHATPKTLLGCLLTFLVVFWLLLLVDDVRLRVALAEVGLGEFLGVQGGEGVVFRGVEQNVYGEDIVDESVSHKRISIVMAVRSAEKLRSMSRALKIIKQRNPDYLLETVTPGTQDPDIYDDYVLGAPALQRGSGEDEGPSSSPLTRWRAGAPSSDSSEERGSAGERSGNWHSMFRGRSSRTPKQSHRSQEQELLREIRSSLTPIKTVPDGRGETLSYLEWIVSHYDRLPDTMVFIHDHLFSWHQASGQSVAVRIEFYLQEFEDRGREYISFAKVDTEVLQRQEEIYGRTGWDPVVLKNFTRAVDEGWISPVTGKPATYAETLWNGTELVRYFGPFPEEGLTISGCCAQFVVGREAIRRFPLRFWVSLRDWVLRYTDKTAPRDEVTPWSAWFTGRLYEYSWETIFTKRPAIAGGGIWDGSDVGGGSSWGDGRNVGGGTT